MKTLAVLSEKGGAGKTTVAVHLAVAAQLAGLTVAIIDLDPQGKGEVFELSDTVHLAERFTVSTQLKRGRV